MKPNQTEMAYELSRLMLSVHKDFSKVQEIENFIHHNKSKHSLEFLGTKLLIASYVLKNCNKDMLNLKKMALQAKFIREESIVPLLGDINCPNIEQTSSLFKSSIPHI